MSSSSPSHTQRLEWSLHVLSGARELGQSYSVLFFLGAVPDAVDEWRTADSFLALHVSHTHAGPPDPREDDHLVESFVPLQRVLKRRRVAPDAVVPYLRAHLSWRIQTVDGDVVDNSVLTSLKVVLFSMTDEQKHTGERTEYPISQSSG